MSDRSDHLVRALAIADTHLRGDKAARLLGRLGPLLDDVDVILHAGDITDVSVIEALAAIAPVHAVLGNNDHGLDLPERFERRIGGRNVAMVHDSGPSTGRAERLRRWFPHADLVLFGHSHIPWNETHTDDDGHVQHHVNPGSAMQRRSQPRCTSAMITLSASGINVEFIAVA